MSATGTGARRVLGAALTVGALAGIAWASAAPLRLHAGGRALLRLSWTARPERIETCRAVSAEELAEVEAQMRQRVICEGRSATYALRVKLDDEVVEESVVRGAGLRHDRPLYLLRELDVPAGVHRLRVSFVRRERVEDDDGAFQRVRSGAEADTGLFAGRAEREREEHERRARAAVPRRLALDTMVVFREGRVVLATFDPDRRALRLVGEGGAGERDRGR